MIVRFQPSLDEIRRLSIENGAYTSRRSSDQLPYKTWIYLLAPVSIVVIAVLSGSFLIAIGSYGLYWSVAAFTNRWARARLRRNYYTEANFVYSLLPIELELTSEHLVMQNAVSSHKYAWRDLSFVRETSGYFQLFFSPVVSVDIPKFALSNEVELQEFLSVVRSHLPTDVLSASGTNVASASV